MEENFFDCFESLLYNLYVFYDLFLLKFYKI